MLLKFYKRLASTTRLSHKVIAFGLASIIPLGAHAEMPEPKLVVMLTIDGLRGDFVTRFEGRFGAGGFKYLLDEGLHFSNAHYQQSNTIV